MEIDHIVPVSANGATTLDNLGAACPSCNGFKAHFLTGDDPATGRVEPLFNPRAQAWQEHFDWSDDFTIVKGLTPTGRGTVARLRMNADDVTLARRRWLEGKLYPPKH